MYKKSPFSFLEFVFAIILSHLSRSDSCGYRTNGLYLEIRKSERIASCFSNMIFSSSFVSWS